MDVIPVSLLENVGARNISIQHRAVAERAGLDTRQVGLDPSVAPAFALWPA